MMSISTSMVKEKTSLKCSELRNTVLEMCIKAGTGHVTSCFSCVEIMVELFYNKMTKDDVFILSKGQASPLMYAILADKGLIDEEELWKFATKDGVLGVHLDHHIKGAVITAGSLGHGLGIATGIAKARKLDNKPGTVYVLLGDGECYEGSVWEAAMFAGNEKLDNLVAIIDQNGYMVTSGTRRLEFVWQSFGWSEHLIKGNSIDDIHSAFYSNWNSPEERHKPLAIVALTTKGKGIPFMEGDTMWHGKAPQGEDAERARRELNDTKYI